MEHSPPGSSVHEISQARILEWIAISSSRGSSRPKDRTHVSCISRWILYHSATWEAHLVLYQLSNPSPPILLYFFPQHLLPSNVSYYFLIYYAYYLPPPLHSLNAKFFGVCFVHSPIFQCLE